MTKTQFITVESNSDSNPNDDVVISFAGPKGGTRAMEALTIDNAKKLQAMLTKAIADFEAYTA